MTTLVCFRADDAEYGVPIESVREVRSHDSLVELPAARPGVAGLLRCNGEALTVLDAFGGQNHVLLLEHGQRGFGLLVEMVTRVVKVDRAIGPPPRGQERDYISGVVSTDDGLLFVVDVAALDERLGP
jgi:chemotaxis signal transduction protein